ncbi:hypothetical protein V6N11_037619 [Hibiscus sabdariffa]|uniref:At2g35280-like TPR domain-containing protein n=1 Tax=Hibiscus sabdariffa TaxID=183260 RepID=A0ABR2PBU6_9ROSI
MKKQRVSADMVQKSNPFDQLPDDLVVSILCNLDARGFDLGSRCRLVWSKLGAKDLVVKARDWSKSALRFLMRCVIAGNVEAYYTLGMIGFYCCRQVEMGKLLLKRVANKSHALAAYSLAIIEFNGSGGSETDKNLRAGIELCMRAASLGHLDTVFELGYLLCDGNRLFPNILAQAVQLVLSLDFSSEREARHQHERHPVNVFLEEWFESRVREGLKLCANKGCGRPETRASCMAKMPSP